MLCLAHRTPHRWVEAALADLDAVLVDHAHCEMKAASNALSLAVRVAIRPGAVATLISVAEEELIHFRRVCHELEQRQLPLGLPPVDAYASDLRRRVRAEPAAPERELAGLVDRLLVAALIEARSCERFRLLAEALEARGPASLAALYQELLAAEARHFRTFVDVAHRLTEPDDAWVDDRLERVAALEAELSASLPGRPAIHG